MISLQFKTACLEQKQHIEKQVFITNLKMKIKSDKACNPIVPGLIKGTSESHTMCFVMYFVDPIYKQGNI